MKACLAYGSIISSVTLNLSLKATAWCHFVRPSPYAPLRWRHICGFPTPGAVSGGRFELSKQSNPEDEEVQEDNRAAASVLGELNGKQRRYLRSIANKRAAAKDGSLVSLRMGSSDNLDAFSKELSVQFKKHELLKVKMPNEVCALALKVGVFVRVECLSAGFKSSMIWLCMPSSLSASI